MIILKLQKNRQNQINKTDKEIIQMVYKLYYLMQDEIKIMEAV